MKAALLNNRYRILKTLGRGGFGETYLTEDTHMPSGRKCVLKQLKPIVKQPKTPLWMKERFQREAAILEDLGEASQQIPRLYAYFSENDKFYLVQEWIEGLTLDQYWEQEGNLHREEVRNILLQILPVLDFVHSRHIIHRDIKPENIIFRQSDSLPVLIDFGAVKEAMATTVNQNSSSMYSASIGTPGFMSSEQAAGRPLYSSDLYSLGLTAIFLLTGKSPHELDTDPGTGEIIWHEYATNVDAELIAVLDKAIKFHPRDRFTTAQEMIAALQPDAKTSNATVATVRIAPQNISSSKSLGVRNDTANLDIPYQKTPQKRGWLVNAVLFILISMGVGVGTFAAGVAILSRLWPSPSTTPQAQVETPKRRPILFPPVDKTETEVQPNEDEGNLITDAETEIASEQEEGETKPELEITKEPEPEIIIDTSDDNNGENAIAAQPKPEPKPELEIDVPIITTGTSENQLVATLGKPTSERPGWGANSRQLAYSNIKDGVTLRYEADSEGTIRETHIAIERSVSLGAMQNTLAKLLGGNAPAGVKEKLRRVYLGETNLSSFRVGNLEGKIRSDSKDRINISIYD